MIKKRILKKIKSSLNDLTDVNISVVLSKSEMNRLCDNIDRFERDFDEALSVMEKIINSAKSEREEGKMQWNCNFKIDDNERDLIIAA
jgi:type III secretory pathway lipoprotein EscJ